MPGLTGNGAQGYFLLVKKETGKTLNESMLRKAHPIAFHAGLKEQGSADGLIKEGLPVILFAQKSKMHFRLWNRLRFR